MAALAAVGEFPFRVIDEIDIYMDSLSRKLAMDTLIQDAKARKQQLVLLTPQDVSYVPVLL